MRRPGAETNVGGSPETMIGPPAAAAARQEKEPPSLCCLLGQTTEVEGLKPEMAAVRSRSRSLKGRTAMSRQVAAAPCTWLPVGQVS